MENSAVVDVYAKGENSYTFYCEMWTNGFFAAGFLKKHRESFRLFQGVTYTLQICILLNAKYFTNFETFVL